MSDEEILDALEAGDPRFGRLLHDRTFRVVHATVHRVLGAGDPDHDDTVQNSFEQIVRSLVGRRFTRACSLTSWATSITTHVALNTIRKRCTYRKYFDEEPAEEVERASGSPNSERQVGARQDLDIVRLELAKMKTERAEAVLLHDVLGHELSEMAVLLGASVSAVQSRLVRGRKELHTRLARVRLR